MNTITLLPHVRDILERSTITANSLVLPPGLLERKTYDEVNKMLTAAGGKWNRSAKGHLFEGDPRLKLGLALETGKVIKEKQVFQEFFTPPAVAARLMELAQVAGLSVLEPSCGRGALIKACRDEDADTIIAIEIKPENAEHSHQQYGCCNIDVHEADFLSFRPRSVDRVVMNPPFTRGADVLHVSRALQWIQHRGDRLVSVMSGRPDTRDRMHKALGTSQFEICFEPIPAKAFRVSGTDVHTQICTIERL